ncbi:MAG TPA: ABC transporter substrate-binding protein [Acidimicrobiia bacterium]|nr:ABC transporter substrate-binding protein [Acidimicrobiia bacterium]
MSVVAALAVIVCLVSGCGSRVGRANLARAGGSLSASPVSERALLPAGGAATAPGAGAAAGEGAGAVPGAAGAPGLSSGGARSGRGSGSVAAPAGGDGAVVAGGGAGVGAGPSAGGRASGGSPASGGGPPAGSSPTGGAPATGLVPAPGGPPKAEIRLGSVGAESGVVGAAMAPVAEGARAWVADVNARGGVNGHPVRLFQVDDGGDPGRSLAIVKRLVEQDHIQALYANHMPTTEEAIVRYVDEKQIPVIGGCSCSSVTDSSPMIFPVGPGAPTGEMWAHLLPLIAQTDHRKVSILYCREAANCQGLADLMQKLADQAGVRIVHTAQVSLAQPDFTAEVLAARNAGADAVVGIFDNATLVRVARSAHRQGYNPTFSIQQAGYDDAMLTGGSDVEGFVTAGIVPDHNISPKLADYRAALARYVPGGRRATISASQWAAGKLIERLGPALGDQPTSATFVEALYGLKGETLGGLLPPTTYERGRGHGATNQCIIPVQVKGGAFIAPAGEQFTCAPGWKPVGT